MYLAIIAIQAVTYAPLVNMFFALGEEVGWRGAMLMAGWILLLSLPILVKNGLFKDFIRVFKMQSKKYSCSLSDMRRSLDVVELMQKQVLYAGGITTIVPIIYVLCSIDNMASLGPNMAVALMTVFYTAILELFLLPLQIELKRRIIDYMEEE